MVITDAGKSFDGTWVVRNLDIEVPHGTVIGLIGPSGCGKTTTMRLANGVHAPDEGSIEVLGTDPARFTGAQRTAIGYLPQTPVLFEHLSLWENLNFHASLNGVRFRRRARLHELLDLVDLEGEQGKLVRQASGGMKRRLALAATLVHRPRLLMLDEPTAGIDPILRRRFWDHFRRLRDQGHTLLVTTQYVGEAADCDLVGLLAHGRLVALAPPEELRRQAFGGELLDIELAARVTEDVVGVLAAIDGVTSTEVVDDRSVRLVVSDAGAVMPLVVEQARRSGHEVVDSEEVVPPYDDVFIELVRRTTSEQDTAITVPS